VTLTIRAEDVLVALEPVRGLSARNAYPAKLASLELERTGVDVSRCLYPDDAAPRPAWRASVTPAAVGALRLSPGSTVWLAANSHSVRLV
jgi:ABC-type molybdate transport system ATPase subunit